MIKWVVKLLFRMPKLYAFLLNLFRHDHGFNENDNIREMVRGTLEQNAITSFVETGSARGNTIYFIHRFFPKLPIFSCESDLNHWRVARYRVKEANVQHLRSEDFIKQFHAYFGEFPFFYLDAHSQPDYLWGQPEDTPLIAEIKLIKKYFTQGIVLMDDITYEGGGRNKFSDIKPLIGRYWFLDRTSPSNTGYLLWILEKQ